jgi:hypothetical protein
MPFYALFLLCILFGAVLPTLIKWLERVLDVD